MPSRDMTTYASGDAHRTAVITKAGATAPAQRAQPRLLLVIGQFEQVFTMCGEEGERRGDPTPQGHLGISALRGNLQQRLSDLVSPVILAMLPIKRIIRSSQCQDIPLSSQENPNPRPQDSQTTLRKIQSLTTRR
jgi:hypothetical protein